MAALFLCAFFMLLYPTDIMLCAREACELFAKAVLPGLFPFLTVMLMATSRMKSNSFFLMALMGIAAGSPAGARLSSFAVFSPKKYRAFALVTSVMSPMFLLGTVPAWLNGHGLPIFIASTAGALMTAAFSLLFPAKKGEGDQSENSELSFSEAVNRAAQTMLTVCGCMVMGSCAGMLIGKLLPNRPLLAGFIEVTKGIKDISQEKSAPALAAMLVSFGGASLLIQNRAFYKKGALPVLEYLLFKTCHAVLGFLLAAALGPLFPARARETAVFEAVTEPFYPLLWGIAFLLSEIVLKWKEVMKRGQGNAAHKRSESRAGGRD
jgi:hypothetical protein